MAPTSFKRRRFPLDVTQQARLLCACAVASIAAIAPALADTAQHCRPDTHKFMTVRGTIHFVRSTVRPMIGRDGKADYSIIDTIDEYELSAPGIICGPKPLRARFEYGDVRYAACADGVPAKVSGFLRRDDADGGIFLSIISPSDLVCKAPE
ncbi:MAG: hypothetical protein SGJ19_00250 [Planctomycetia bacterium]|nr:hypothetical protein [Planctomycetia bacterium]